MQPSGEHRPRSRGGARRDRGGRPIRRSVLLLPLAAAVSALLVGSVPAGAATSSAPGKARLQALLVTAGQMPSGWKKGATSAVSGSGAKVPAKTCSTSRLVPGQVAEASVEYAYGKGLPVFSEDLASARNISSGYTATVSALDACSKLDFPNGSSTVKAAMSTTTFPTVGQESAAYQIDYVADGVNVPTEMVVARQGPVLAAFLFADTGGVDEAQFQQLITRATAKIPTS